jgi:starvation-inducible DNA-binding protein
MKEYKKLGFSSEETKEIVDALNKLLANFQVHYQKLRNFHWNVEGPDFFELHDQFEEEYDQVKLQIDEIAERIRVFGHKPLSTLADYLKVSEISEAGTDLSAKKMVEEVIKDYEFLLSFMVEAISAAEEIDDSATEDLITGYMKRTEQRHWMFSAWAKR